MALLKKRDCMVSRFIFVRTTGQLTQKWDDPVKNGTSGHPTLDTIAAFVIPFE
jgi:hypothetical protein